MVTNDLEPNANINMFIGCSAHGEHSTIEGDIVRTVLVDDESNRVTFDWAISEARDGGFATESWVHIALSVDGQRVRTFVDGAEVQPQHIGYNSVAEDAVWEPISTTINNIEEYNAWVASDPSIDVNASCIECYAPEYRDCAFDDECEFDEASVMAFPMYLALDSDQGHDDVSAIATVESFLAWKGVPFRAWRRGQSEGDKRGSALFKEAYWNSDVTCDESYCSSPDGGDGTDCCASMERWNEPQTCSGGMIVTDSSDANADDCQYTCCTPRKQMIRSEDEHVVTGYSTIEVTHDLSWQMTRENEAYPSPTRLNGRLTTFTITNPIFLGVKADLTPGTYYEGHIADVSIFPYPIEAEAVDCLYRDVINGEDGIAICARPDEMRSRTYVNDMMDDTGMQDNDRITLGGDAAPQHGLGVVFDGDGDYMSIEMSRWQRSIRMPSTYNFWMTKTACHDTVGRYEHLYSQMQNTSDLMDRQLNILVACPASSGDLRWATRSRPSARIGWERLLWLTRAASAAARGCSFSGTHLHGSSILWSHCLGQS